MEFCLYANDLELLAEPDEFFRAMTPEELPAALRNAVLNDPNAMEYVAHLHAAGRMEELGFDADAVERLYFGQEFCDQLIPSAEELCSAFFLARQYGWEFTVVTGVVADWGLDAWLERLRALERVVEDAGAQVEVEVVVNDWGMLRMLRRETPGFRLLLGRMLVKQKRLGEFPQHFPPPCTIEIDAPLEDLVERQAAAWRNLNLTLPRWREALHAQSIERIELDVTPQGVELAPDEWGFRFSAYYPWSYLTSSRACPTAGLVDPVRRYKPVDVPCPRVCRTANVNLTHLAVDPAPILHRGRVVMVFNDVFSEPYLRGSVPVDRLVYEPYIPL